MVADREGWWMPAHGRVCFRQSVFVTASRLPRKIRSNESEKIHTATGSLVACMGSQLVNHRYGMGPPTEATEPTGRDCPNEATH